MRPAHATLAAASFLAGLIAAPLVARSSCTALVGFGGAVAIPLLTGIAVGITVARGASGRYRGLAGVGLGLAGAAVTAALGWIAALAHCAGG